MGKLSDITGTTIHAVGAWFNHYRSDVKIPFLKVCMIAKEFNVELEDLIRGEKLKYQSKFAVLSLKDDDQITVLKTFGSSEEDKERALAAGEKLAENRPEDEVYAVVLTEFDEDDNIKEDSYEIYEVWDDMSDKIIEELQD